MKMIEAIVNIIFSILRSCSFASLVRNVPVSIKRMNLKIRNTLKMRINLKSRNVMNVGIIAIRSIML